MFRRISLTLVALATGLTNSWSQEATRAEKPLPFEADLRAKLEEQGKQIRRQNLFHSAYIVPREVEQPEELPAFGHSLCPRLDHLGKPRVFKSLHDAPVPEVPFALLMLIGDDEYAHLPRFKATLQALVMKDGNVCNLTNSSRCLESLPELTELRHLQILTDIGKESQFRLETLTKLRSLSIRSRWLTDEGFTSLRELENLVELELPYTKVTGTGLAGLKCLPRLIALDLTGAPTTSAGVRNLRECVALKELKLKGGACENEALASLQELKNLRALDLSDTVIGDAGVKYLAGLENLETLNLENTLVTSAALETLAALPKLKSLDLWNTPTAEKDLQPFLDRNVTVRWADRRIRFVPEVPAVIEKGGQRTIVEGRRLEEWFADFDGPSDDAGRVAAIKAEIVLRKAAQTDLEVCRLAFYYGNQFKQPRVDRGRETGRIIRAAGHAALPAIYEQLSDGLERDYDYFCIEQLTTLNDTSPSAIAALIQCLHAKPRGNGDNLRADRAAQRLKEIGLPVLQPLLADRRLDRQPTSYSRDVILSLGESAADSLWEYSLDHPDDFLTFELGRICEQAPEKIAPRVVSLLQDPERGVSHASALHTLAAACEPKVASYKRIPVELTGEHVVETVTPFLDLPERRLVAAKVIAGWSPKTAAAREKITRLFLEDQTHRGQYLRTLASFDEVPAEAAPRLLELHQNIAGLFLEPLHRALSRLPADCKAELLPKLIEQAPQSARAAIAVLALQPEPATRDKMQRLLREMKKDPGKFGSVEALLRWLPNLGV